MGRRPEKGKRGERGPIMLHERTGRHPWSKKQPAGVRIAEKKGDRKESTTYCDAFVKVQFTIQEHPRRTSRKKGVRVRDDSNTYCSS